MFNDFLFDFNLLLVYNVYRLDRQGEKNEAYDKK